MRHFFVRLLPLFLVFQAQTARAVSSGALDAPITDVEEIAELVGPAWPYKIRAICAHQHVPCGIEESPADPVFLLAEDHEHEEHLELSWARTTHTAREVLDAVLANHPAYHWEFRDGVLNVVPKPGAEHRKWWRPLLQRKVRNLDVQNEPAGTAVITACDNAGLSIPIAATGMSSIPETARISVHLANMPLREALNAIVKADGEAIWKFAVDPRTGSYSIKVDSWRQPSVLAVPW